MSQYAVAAYTFGSFRDFVMDPGTLEEAQEFVANPPDWYGSLREQDSLRIFELVEVDE